LIRWLHPDKGIQLPGTFLPAIEDHLLSVDIGEWVIETAITQHQTWMEMGLHIPVSVNIGALQLQQTDFVQRLHAALGRHPKVNPTHIQMEILETSALQDMHKATATINACKEIGVDFALDDFGTGYSSLTYLRQLPVSVLKIDQSFVRNMLENTEDQKILKGVIGLAEAFGRRVIAEGVETEAHGTLLLQLGCEAAQGYGIARPMTADNFPAWVGTWRPNPDWAHS
jgi:EAL domain-containing protein (putative c-di-GMP-specific phosphodiesterase class I)